MKNYINIYVFKWHSFVNDITAGAGAALAAAAPRSVDEHARAADRNLQNDDRNDSNESEAVL
jgi:hypothetical protein